MNDHDLKTLRLRLKSCLATILELEPQLARLEVGAVLSTEFTQLKTFIERVQGMDLVEADVERIEAATASFLKELEEPLALLGERCDGVTRIH